MLNVSVVLLVKKILMEFRFTVDASMQIHCLDCFHQKIRSTLFFPVIELFLPSNGEEETVRIVALDRSYHFDCYRCEVNYRLLLSKYFIFFLLEL